MTQAINAVEFTDRYGLSLEELSSVATRIGVTPNGPFLVGGSVRRLIIGQPQDSDFDVGFASFSQLDESTATLLGKGAKQTADTDFYRGFTFEINGKARVIQFLKVAYGSAADVIDSFDFTICQTAYDSERLIFGDFTLYDLGRKRLAIHKVTHAKSTVRRLLKYGKQGFTVCSGCIDSILKAVVANPSLADSEVQYVD